VQPCARWSHAWCAVPFTTPRWNFWHNNRNQDRIQYTSSVDIRPEWPVLEQIQLTTFTKLTGKPPAGEPETIAECGHLEYYDKNYDRVGGKQEVRAPRRAGPSTVPLLERAAAMTCGATRKAFCGTGALLVSDRPSTPDKPRCSILSAASACMAPPHTASSRAAVNSACTLAEPSPLWYGAGAFEELQQAVVPRRHRLRRPVPAAVRRQGVRCET
jgi:hypothetical protein